MPQARDRIYNVDRFVPSRSLIDFDAAYYKFACKNWDIPSEIDYPRLPSYTKRMEFRKNLEKVANLNQRLFRTSMQGMKVKKNIEDQIWPCVPRKKPYLVNERILDLPEFNRGFHLANTMDWGSNDIIVTSVLNRIVAGVGFLDKHVATETVTEFDNDIGTAVSWSGNGVNLAVGTETGIVQVWNMPRKKLVLEERCCGEQNCTVTGLQWHPMQHSLVWACSGGKISRRDFRDNITTEVEFAHSGCICNLKYSPKANYLCSSGQDGYVRIWRGDTCEPYMEIEMSNPARAIAWHPWRSGLLAVGESFPASGSLSIWNVNTGKMQYMSKPAKPVAIKALDFNKLSGELVCSHWVPDGDKEHCEIVVLGGPDYAVDIVKESNGCVTSLLWNPDGTKLGTAGSDETFKIWKFYKPRDEDGRKRKKNFDLMAFNKCHSTVSLWTPNEHPHSVKRLTEYGGKTSGVSFNKALEMDPPMKKNSQYWFQKFRSGNLSIVNDIMVNVWWNAQGLIHYFFQQLVKTITAMS